MKTKLEFRITPNRGTNTTYTVERREMKYFWFIPWGCVEDWKFLTAQVPGPHFSTAYFKTMEKVEQAIHTEKYNFEKLKEYQEIDKEWKKKNPVKIIK